MRTITLGGQHEADDLVHCRAIRWGLPWYGPRHWSAKAAWPWLSFVITWRSGRAQITTSVVITKVFWSIWGLLGGVYVAIIRRRTQYLV